MLSPEEVALFAEAKALAHKKKCVVSNNNGIYKLFRKSGERVIFIGKRTDMKKFLELVKRA